VSNRFNGFCVVYIPKIWVLMFVAPSQGARSSTKVFLLVMVCHPAKFSSSIATTDWSVEIAGMGMGPRPTGVG